MGKDALISTFEAGAVTREARQLKIVREEFGTLAFCERWCTALEPKASAHLRTLVRYGAIDAYPILTEVKGGMISQTEHTLLIKGSRTQVAT